MCPSSFGFPPCFSPQFPSLFLRIVFIIKDDTEVDTSSSQSISSIRFSSDIDLFPSADLRLLRSFCVAGHSKIACFASSGLQPK